MAGIKGRVVINQSQERSQMSLFLLVKATMKTWLGLGSWSEIAESHVAKYYRNRKEYIKVGERLENLHI